jgi:hypothetical protein
MPETEGRGVPRGENVPAAPPAAVIEQFGAGHTPVDDGEEIFPGFAPW